VPTSGLEGVVLLEVVPRVGLETPWDWGWLGVVAGAGLV
jgi:hypothetical protein